MTGGRVERGGLRGLGFLGRVASLAGCPRGQEPQPRDQPRSWGVIGSENPMSNLRLLLAEEDQNTRTFLAVICRC
jgi:hypothetical protein